MQTLPIFWQLFTEGTNYFDCEHDWEYPRKISKRRIRPISTTSKLTRIQHFQCFFTVFHKILSYYLLKHTKFCWTNGFLTENVYLDSLRTSYTCVPTCLIITQKGNPSTISTLKIEVSLCIFCWLNHHIYQTKDVNIIFFATESRRFKKPYLQIWWTGLISFVKSWIFMEHIIHESLNRQVDSVSIVRSLPILWPLQFEFFKGSIIIFLSRFWNSLKITFYRRISKNHTDIGQRAGNKKKC